MQLLTQNEITQINHTIRDMSRDNNHIEYVSAKDTPIREDKLHILTYRAPKHTILINTATYYMKNIILLQCFPDGNHRTALESVRLFFHKNNVDFKWDLRYVIKYQIDIYKLRYKVYNTYEELPASVLYEPRNSLWIYCRNCIEDNLS